MTTTALLTWRLPRAKGEGQQTYTGDWFPNHPLQFTTRLHYTSIQNNTIPNNALSFSSLPYFTLPYNALHTTMCYTTLYLLHYTLHFTALNDTTLICSIALHLNTKQYLTLAYLIHLFPTIRKLPYTLHYITLHTILHFYLPLLHFYFIHHSCIHSLTRSFTHYLFTHSSSIHSFSVLQQRTTSLSSVDSNRPSEELRCGHMLHLLDVTA